MSGGLRGMIRRLLFGSGEPENVPLECLNGLRSRLTSEVEIRRLILDKGKIPAIKAFRQQTDAPIKEAKAAVDAMAQEFVEGSSSSSSPEQ